MRSKNAVYNIFTNFLLQLVVIVYGFVVPKIIISHFGSDVNGLVSSITQFLAYITLLESGFGPVVKAVLYKPIAKKDNKKITSILKSSEKFFRTISIIFIIYIMALCIFYPLVINNNFDKLFTISLIIIISISTFAEYFFGMTYRLFLQADQKTYIISIIQIATYILSIIAIVILAIFNSSIQMIKLVSGLIFVLRPILQNWYVKKKYNIKLKEVKEEFKLKQKWDGLAQHIASVIHANTDITLLTFFCELEEVSVYSVYYLVVKGIKQLIQAFSNGIDSSFGDMIAKNEHENLNSKFHIYELLYFTIATIMFTCTILLITPFISVYTKNITDANYVRKTFGYLLVIGEYIWAIRLPYSNLTLAAGHFKETRIGAWIEATINIIISIILVNKYGIIGVAIGTLIAMLIRTIEFVIHTNKQILKRNIFVSIKKILLCAIETTIVILLVQIVPKISGNTYISWLSYSLIIFIITTIITVTINYIIYKKDFAQILTIIKKIRKKE